MATFNTSNVQLTYKELQAKLKELRNNGHDVQCKLNSKHDVLVGEYNRIIRIMEQELQQALSDSNPVQQDATALSEDTTTQSTNDRYPFTSNTVQVYNTSTLLAMNAKLAPSWLTRPQKVYIIDGVDYLPHELEMQLQGMVADGTNSCELTCEWNAPEQQSASVQCSTTDDISTTVQLLAPHSPGVLNTIAHTNVQCKLIIQRHWERYITQQDPTVQQAAVNGMEILRCTKAFLKGFITGLSAIGRKQYLAAN